MITDTKEKFLNAISFTGSTCSLSDSDEDFEGRNEQEDDFSTLEDPPLYEGAPISVNDCLLAVLALMIRHELAWSCVKDILMLIFFVCKPVHNNMKASLYLFRKYFSALKCPVLWHYYCSGCYKKLSNSKACCPNAGKHPKVKGVSYFLEIPLLPQLVALFSQQLFADSIQHRFSRKKANPNSLTDIYDGQLYKEQVANNGFLSKRFPFNISFMWNTDGIPIFKSTAISLWPVMFTINELPINMRFKKQYVLLGGLWFGKKPEGNIIMQPFQQSLKNLYDGFDVILPDNSPARARAMLLCGTCDLPAKSSFLGMISHSGAWGCSVCKQKGESVATTIPTRKRKKPSNQGRQQMPENETRKGSVWVYRFQEDMELRNHSEMESYGKEAFKEAKRGLPFKLINVFGVKQPSVLTSLFRDVCRGMAVDQMHCLWLGMMKKFLHLWFDKKYSSEKFSLIGKVHLVEELFLNICPPNFVKRGVRSLIENLARLKASELKNFALYFSLPILHKIMPDIYYDHYHEFISCISILCSSSITPEQLIDCDRRLKNWVKKFEELYGVRHMVMCVHLVCHLAFVVNNLGPLWTSSCTPFENINGILKRMIHGTRCVEIQLANSAYMVLNFPNSVKAIRSRVVRDWCMSLLYSGTPIKILEKIDDSLSSVGCYLSNDVDTSITTLLESEVGNITCQIFARLKKGSYLFLSESYTRQKKSKSNIVSYDLNNKKMFGSILMFCRISDCGCKDDCFCKPASYYAVIKPFIVEPHFSKLDSLKDICFIWQVRLEQPKLIIVPVNSLKEIVFYVPSKDFVFLCERVNSVEAE